MGSNTKINWHVKWIHLPPPYIYYDRAVNIAEYTIDI